MLVCVWNGMDAAIPRIRAEQNLDQYTVMVAASPYADQTQTRRIIEGWTERIRAGFDRAVRVSLKTMENLLTDAFGGLIGGKEPKQ
jgi:hypothetical protein